MYRKFNLKTRMLVSICSVTFLAFAVTIIFVTVTAGKMARIEASNKAQEIAHRYSAEIKIQLDEALVAARTLANTFPGIKDSSRIPDRKMVDDILISILKANPGWMGIWACFEPNALDGKDSEYVNAKGHDGTGRYIAWWNRISGSIDVAPSGGYDTGAWYQVPLKTGKELIVEPYVTSQGVMAADACVPITYHGTRIGVAGLDFGMEYCEKLITKIKPFETGYGFLLSNHGMVVAHPKKEVVGKNIKDLTWSNKVVDAIEQGKEITEYKSSELTGKDSFVIFVPVNLGRSATPWSLAVSVPMDKIFADAHHLRNISLLIGVLALSLLMGVVFFIAKSIADPMNRVVAGLNEGTDQVASASGQVSSASQSLAEGSSEQAASLEETSSSLEEMASMTKQNADNASQADHLTKAAVVAIGNANDSMKEMAASMDDISKASGQTSRIIKTIDEIAFQTNLLALNAAVEAARAGEAGAGFAVVADEVKNLAMRSAEAAKNTADLIEGTVKKVADGSALVNKTNEGFAAMADSAGKVAELVAEIAAASNEQARGIEQVNTAVMDMDKVTQQNAANAEESASASEEMNAQAEQMKAVVGELVAIVGSNGAGAKQAKARKNSNNASLPVIEKRSAAKTSPSRLETEIRPQRVIPMEDDDFKDF